MPARREGGSVGQTYRPPRKRKTSSGGHPSRGGTTVGGGTGGRKPTRYRSPTPSVPTQRRGGGSQGHPSQGAPTVGGGTSSRPRRYKSPTPSVRRQRQERRAETKRAARKRRVARQRAAGRMFAQLPKPGRAPDVGFQGHEDDLRQKLGRAIESLPNPPKPKTPKAEGIPSPAAAIRNQADEQRRARVRATRTPKPDAESRAFRANARREAVRGFKGERARQPRLQRAAKHTRQGVDDALELRDRRIREYEQGKLRTKAEKQRAADELKKAGIDVPTDPISDVLGTGAGAAIDILEETTRPLHALTAAERSFLKGEGPVDVAKAGVKGLKNEDKSTFSDVLGDLGVPKGPARSVAGFVGDVIGDPLTYVTFGTGSAVRAGALKAGEKAAKAAAKAGMSEAGQATVRRAAIKKVMRAAEAEGRGNKGVQVGIGRRGPRTSGRATAYASRKLGLSKGATSVRNRSLTQDVGATLRPDFRRKGVPHDEHANVRAADAERRAGIESAERRLEKTAETFHKLDIADQQRILDAIESGSLKALREESPELHRAAVRLRSDLRYMRRAELRAGISVRNRKNYVPRVRRQDVEGPRPTGRGAHFARSPKRPGSSKGRTFKTESTLAELRETDPELFTDEVAKILSKRGTQSIHAVARQQFERALAAGGRKLTRKSAAEMGDGEAIYHLAPGQGLRKVYPVDEHTGQAIREVEDALAGPAGQGRVYYHGTDEATAERLMTNGGFGGSRRGVVWGGTEETARNYGEHVIKIRVNPTHTLDVRDPDYAEVVYGAQTASAVEKAVRDAGYDALTDNSQGWIKVFDKDAVTVGSKGGTAKSGQYVILNERATDDAIQAAQPNVPGPIHERYRRVHGTYKTLLTQPMPSYHVRNFMGDVSNAWYEQNAAQLIKSLMQSGRGMRELARMRKNEGKLTLSPHGPAKGHTFKLPGGEVSTYADELALAEAHGAIGSGFTRDLHELLGGKPLRLKTLRTIGQYRENHVRFATWLGARRQGLSPREAAARARELHFDYGDLTKTERIIRDLIPFYTFAARNTPLQAKKLITRPGKVATYQKGLEEAAKAAGLPEDWQQNLDDWQKYGIPIPVPGLNANGMPLLAIPYLPITDLNRLATDPEEQYYQFMQMLSGFKAIPEIIQNFSYFYRGEIDVDGRLVPAPSFLQALPDEMQDTVELQYVYDKALGKKIWKYNATWDYFLRQLPETRFLWDMTTEGKNRKGQGVGAKVVSAVGGVKPVLYNPLKHQTDELYERMKQVDRRIGQLNDQNIYADNATKEYKHLTTLRQKLRERIEKTKRMRKRAGEQIALPHKRGGGGYFDGVSDGPVKGYFDDAEQDTGGSYFDDLD